MSRLHKKFTKKNNIKRILLIVIITINFGNTIDIFAYTKSKKNSYKVDIKTQKKDNDYLKEDNNYLLLANKYNVLDKTYLPEDLINISSDVNCTKTIYLNTEAAKHYINMVKAMEEEGVSGLTGVSGYRDYDYQNNLHKNQINYYRKRYSAENAKIFASRVVAPPGESEHQTGLALDVSTKSIGYGLTERF